jgi:hypothetical protein
MDLSLIKSLISHPRLFLSALWSSRIFHFVPDRIFLKIKYFLIFGKRLNLKNPQTFNEKIQWLKLYDRKPEYTQIVDKYEVRKYIEDRIGNEYLIPLFGVWDNFDDINFDNLPNQFVLKANHFSGGVFICKDKQGFDIEKTRKEMNKVLKRNYYFYGREWPYKNVKPRIKAEKYMVDESGVELKDYKIYCYDGLPKYILVCSERYLRSGLKKTFFDPNWNYIHGIVNWPKSEQTIKEPHSLKEMLRLSRLLSKDISFLRVDFYEVQEKIYFGELTIHPAAGFEDHSTPDWDKKMGEGILSNEKLVRVI